MNRTKASDARQRLRKTEKARAAWVERILGAGEMVAGSFVELGRKCGKPNCRCAHGEKHYGKFLSRSEGGKTRLVFVPQADEVEVSTKAERYRQLREARAELMKLASQAAEYADALAEALTEPYPPTERAEANKRSNKATADAQGGKNRPGGRGKHRTE